MRSLIERRLTRLEAGRRDNLSRLSDAELDAEEVAILGEILRGHPDREAVLALSPARRIIATLPIITAFLTGREWDRIIVIPAAEPSAVEMSVALGDALSCRA